MTDIAKILAQELGIKTTQVEATIKLIDEGNTIPFISRYRKEVTGSLNDEILRQFDERLRYLRNLEEKKEQVISAIEEQGKLTEELKKEIESAMTLVAVDDLYRPFRPKRRTRAMIAIEKGLENFANDIYEEKLQRPAIEEGEKYLSNKEGLEVESPQDAIAGAMDIIAEKISDDAAFRNKIRDMSYKQGILMSNAKDEGLESVYENYYNFAESVSKTAGYKILAINRGEDEKVLTVKLDPPTDDIIRYLEKIIIKKHNPHTQQILKDTIEDAYKRLIAPSIERDIRSSLTESAEDEAIKVFGKNLTQLLMQPPVAGRVVLGWDPAFRTGCKLAVVDETGKVLDTKVIYPTAPQNKVAESKKILKELIKKYNISLISLGNGTASRESEAIIVELIKEVDSRLEYIIVNEAGASVYSASKLATEEFPNFDVGQRSAASIARRLEDPLAELVKIDPKSIGVGQYQHDMNQKKLSEALSAVVEDCVNKVGVDLNTASAPLLEYISGISKADAKNIVIYREENGSFKSRKELLKVSKLGPKAFEQCAGFLRINEGKEPLDMTSVHPESYDATKKLLESLGYSTGDITLAGLNGISKKISDFKKVSEDIGIGEITLKDIVKELEKPGRDPRDEMQKPILRTDVLEMEDLKEGMKLSGTVRNVVDFGAFVDIGVKQDGLVHVSKLSKKFVKNPMDIVSVGDIVDVWVYSIDKNKDKVSLTMIDPHE